MALFGDITPFTTTHLTTPAGFKVVRVDPDSGQAMDFAVNKIGGPASKLPHEGFERPSHYGLIAGLVSDQVRRRTVD